MSAEPPAAVPTFLIIGAMKAGTTSLWRTLGAHPQVHMAHVKEPHFFSNPDRYERGLDWYRELFAGATPEAIAFGEASTNYTKHPRRTGTAARVVDANPDVRLVYVVREPFARIRSHHVHVADSRDERRPLRAAVLDDPEYVDICRYRTQIDQYLPHVDRSQLLVLTTDELRAEPDATLRRALAFIGVDPELAAARRPPDAQRADLKRVARPFTGQLRRLPAFDTVRSRAPAAAKRTLDWATTRPVSDDLDLTLPDELRDRIAAELRDEVAGLRPFLGPDFDGWGLG